MHPIRFHYNPAKYLLTRCTAGRWTSVAWGPLGSIRCDEVEPPALPGPEPVAPIVAARTRSRLRSLLLLGAIAPVWACSSRGAQQPAPISDQTLPASLIAKAEAGDWTLRVSTEAGETLVGTATAPAPGLVRIRARDVPLDDLVSIERRMTRENGLSSAKAMAGAAVGGMLGIVLGWVVQYPSDSPCEGCTAKWFVVGGIAGFIFGVRAGRPDVDVRWEMLWRRH